MPELIVTTSWDDGSIDDLKLAALLTKQGIKGTFYLPGVLNQFTPLQKEDNLALASLHEIGAHTLTHPHLTQIPEAEAKTEIKHSKLYLEEILNRKITMFSYPYGQYNEDIKRIIKDCGFTGARRVQFNPTGALPDAYEFGVTVEASNGRFYKAAETSPEMDWEARAKKLFDSALKNGGIWHMWGQSWDI
jgi:peptidoglycan/xylan/chitin deacetylase (PgdA/CDA1 family)